MNVRLLWFILFLLGNVQVLKAQDFFDPKIQPADVNAANFVPLLAGNRVALVINQTSCVGDSSLLDLLLQRGIAVKKIFVPEHGFRGREDAGAHIADTRDSATGIPVISLYGSHKKPLPADLEDVDILVYDLQDVGVRFYTYISTLEYCMQACAEQHKKMVILDRPDPNGFYVDGPVLEKERSSFVGMQPVPIVYGMTCGEYALMLKGERWYERASETDLKVVPCRHYSHKARYKLPVPPSPNLKNMASVYAYPSVCLFEGTVLSVGRGTGKPFLQFGAPALAGSYHYSFTPKSMPGARNPPFENQMCYGELLSEDPEELLQSTGGRLNIDWVVKAYAAYPEKDKFFTSFFTRLCGTDKIEEEIKKGTAATRIRKGWGREVSEFKKIRKKYLLYEDFE